jgi:hypothetical protein
MWKITDAVENIEEHDLYKFRDDLEKGAPYLKKLVNDRLRALEKSKKGICVTCGNELAFHPRSYTLVFGPDDFRKKASFCELDCLQYFLHNLKTMTKGEKDAVQASDKAF